MTFFMWSLVVLIVLGALLNLVELASTEPLKPRSRIVVAWSIPISLFIAAMIALYILGVGR